MSPSFGEPFCLSGSDMLTFATSSPAMYGLISLSPLRLYCFQSFIGFYFHNHALLGAGFYLMVAPLDSWIVVKLADSSTQEVLSDDISHGLERKLLRIATKEPVTKDDEFN